MAHSVQPEPTIHALKPRNTPGWSLRRLPRQCGRCIRRYQAKHKRHKRGGQLCRHWALTGTKTSTRVCRRRGRRLHATGQAQVAWTHAEYGVTRNRQRGFSTPKYPRGLPRSDGKDVSRDRLQQRRAVVDPGQPDQRHRWKEAIQTPPSDESKTEDRMAEANHERHRGNNLLNSALRPDTLVESTRPASTKQSRTLTRIRVRIKKTMI